MNYQSPDEQELAATVQPFAFPREIFLRLFCAFCAFLRLLILPLRPLRPLREAPFFYS
jgi:hypothetical protein